MLCTLIALMLLMSSAPPLTAEQMGDLESARDGSDHRDQAVFAVIENIRTWQADIVLADDGEPMHLTIDPLALNARPEDFRSELFRIEGELLQQTPLAPPYDDVTEWFIREARTGLPVIVYAVGLDEQAAFAERQRVRIVGRFVKRVRLTARDGAARDYPAFVGRYPVALAGTSPQQGASASSAFDALWIIGSIVAALLVAFIIVRIWASRHARIAPMQGRGPSRLRSTEAIEPTVDEAADLPDDPVEALAELKRRAES